MFNPSKLYDVLAIGGGNAALCAAISGARDGATVLVVEAAPRFYRGGLGANPGSALSANQQSGNFSSGSMALHYE